MSDWLPGRLGPAAHLRVGFIRPGDARPEQKHQAILRHEGDGEGQSYQTEAAKARRGRKESAQLHQLPVHRVTGDVFQKLQLSVPGDAIRTWGRDVLLPASRWQVRGRPSAFLRCAGRPVLRVPAQRGSDLPRPQAGEHPNRRQGLSEDRRSRILQSCQGADVHSVWHPGVSGPGAPSEQGLRQVRGLVVLRRAHLRNGCRLSPVPRVRDHEDVREDNRGEVPLHTAFLARAQGSGGKTPPGGSIEEIRNPERRRQRHQEARLVQADQLACVVEQTSDSSVRAAMPGSWGREQLRRLCGERFNGSESR